MKMLLKALAAAGVLAASGATGAEYSANVTLASDYSFRGWSQTLRDPAIQGGFDVGFESGFSVGTWASTVNFGDTVGATEPRGGTSMEWDLYVGWSKELSEGLTLDLTAIYFDYPNERDALNYQEYAAALSFGDVSVSVNYSPAYLGEEDVSFFYPAVSYSKGFTDDVSVSASIGYNKADSPDGDFFGEGDDYVDYSASVSYSTGVGIDVSVGLVGTNNKDGCGDDCKLRPVFSLSKSL